MHIRVAVLALDVFAVLLAPTSQAVMTATPAVSRTEVNRDDISICSEPDVENPTGHPSNGKAGIGWG